MSGKITRETWTRFIENGQRAQKAADALVVRAATITAGLAVSLTTEKEWQEQVERIAALFRWKKYHTLDSRGSDEDFPDLILLRGRRQVVAELKKAGEEPRPGQLEWLAAFAEAGAETYVWQPADFDEVSRILR